MQVGTFVCVSLCLCCKSEYVCERVCMRARARVCVCVCVCVCEREREREKNCMCMHRHPVCNHQSVWSSPVSGCSPQSLAELLYPTVIPTCVCYCIAQGDTCLQCFDLTENWLHLDSVRATRGVTVSMSAFLACHQCYCAGSSLVWGLNLRAIVCGIFWSLSPGVFSGYSGFLPSFIGLMIQPTK